MWDASTQAFVEHLSGRENVRQGCVWSGKCLSGKCPSGKTPSGKRPAGMCPGILEFTFVLIIFARLLPICLLNFINIIYQAIQYCTRSNPRDLKFKIFIP